MLADSKGGIVNQPILVVFAGLPLSGKTTLSRKIASALKIHCIDVDNVLKLAVGGLNEEQYARRWRDPEKAAEITKQEMKLVHVLIHAIVDFSLEAQKSLIICATYSRKSTQEFLREIVRRHNARLQIIVCNLENDTRQEIEKRMNREDNRGTVYGPKSLAHYETVKSYFESPATSDVFEKEEVLAIDTSSPIANLDLILKFINT